MKKSFILLCLCFTTIVKAQTLISSSGTTNQADGIEVSWSIGEISINTSLNNNILTEGYQQPAKITITDIEKIDADFKFSAYPNPTNAFVNIVVSSINEKDKPMVNIFDSNGKIIKANIQNYYLPNQAKYTVDLENMLDGYYYFTIILNNKTLGSFKVLKIN